MFHKLSSYFCVARKYVRTSYKRTLWQVGLLLCRTEVCAYILQADSLAGGITSVSHGSMCVHPTSGLCGRWDYFCVVRKYVRTSYKRTLWQVGLLLCRTEVCTYILQADSLAGGITATDGSPPLLACTTLTDIV